MVRHSLSKARLVKGGRETARMLKEKYLGWKKKNAERESEYHP